MNSNVKSGIYKITNIENGKVYVGGSRNIEKKFGEHRKMLVNNDHSAKFQQDYNNAKDKSIFKFEVIEYVDDLNMLHDREQHYINLCDSFNAGYNSIEKAGSHKIYGSKKIKNRFNLKFNKNDQQHLIVSGILNNLRPAFKAQYIVDAIICYENYKCNI